MNAHTPGPWKQNVLLVNDEHGKEIAHCTRWENGRPMPAVAEANARLIAAAPELLDALKDAVREIPEPAEGLTCHVGITTMEHCGRCQRAARMYAALAKAEATEGVLK